MRHQVFRIKKKSKSIRNIKNVDKPTIPVTDENKIVEILVKWWEKKYPMMEGQRNHHAYVLVVHSMIMVSIKI